MSTNLDAFWRDEAGATAIEYSIIALMIGVAIIGALSQIAPQLIPIFESVADGMTGP